jgi:sugar/nucleoside kinase (ribokinase family)
MTGMGPGVICSGSIVHDTVVCPVEETCWGTTTFIETIEPHLGGNGANTSLALATIGIPVRLLGTIGADEEGRFALEILRQRGVDTSGVSTADAPTAASIVLVNRHGERKFLHRTGASASAFPAPVAFTRELTDGMSHYHLASLFLLPKLRVHAAECLARARAAGLTTSLDTNWDPHGLWMRDLGPCLPHLDVIFTNEDEARMTTGSPDPAIAAGRLLAGGARLAVMKLGPRGCAIYNGAEEILCPAFEVEAKDTTGAGDCFAGGFLAALQQGASLAEAGRFANAVGAMSVQHVGGGTGLRPYPEIQAWMGAARFRRPPE